MVNGSRGPVATCHTLMDFFSSALSAITTAF
jgi:hypothetical protein